MSSGRARFIVARELKVIARNVEMSGTWHEVKARDRELGARRFIRRRRWFIVSGRCLILRAKGRERAIWDPPPLSSPAARGRRCISG